MSVSPSGSSFLSVGEIRNHDSAAMIPSDIEQISPEFNIDLTQVLVESFTTLKLRFGKHSFKSIECGTV